MDRRQRVDLERLAAVTVPSPIPTNRTRVNNPGPVVSTLPSRSTERLRTHFDGYADQGSVLGPRAVVVLHRVVAE